MTELTENIKPEDQVKSKERVTDYGEVFTNEREVNAMLDLVKHETERIESSFLEPACGNGNFLAEVLRRKLAVVDSRYSKSQNEWEKYGIITISSIYGVDILEDNVIECRERLFQILSKKYLSNFGTNGKIGFLKSVRFILSKNIIWGDALDFTNPVNKRRIVFSEWSIVLEDKIKRRDYIFKFMVDKSLQTSLFNDLGGPADIDEPVKEYPLVHFLKLSESQISKG